MEQQVEVNAEGVMQVVAQQARQIAVQAGQIVTLLQTVEQQKAKIAELEAATAALQSKS